MRNKSTPKPTKLKKRMRTASSCTVFLQQILHHFSLCMEAEKMKDNNFHMEEASEASMSCLCL